MTHKARRVKKEDIFRVVLTETCPYEVPVIFSNAGFYWHLKKHDAGRSQLGEVFEYLFCRDLSSEFTIPLSYSVRKDVESSRTVSLLHPRSQYSFVAFYRDFAGQMLLACQKSQCSIRKPEKIAGKYFTPNRRQDLAKYRSGTISMASTETRNKHLSSYFSYAGYPRLHKFFDSSDFLSLERKFSEFWSLDVAKFFDSIYTHSISWALSSKEFAKQNKAAKNSFGALFDRLMQASNYNETAGILIGPEVSRIFAEIIFQQIDVDVRLTLEGQNLRAEEDYAIRRYVDDIFVFSVSEGVATKVYLAVESCAKKYKLNFNSAKTVKSSRPFVTQKTKSIGLAKNVLSAFTNNVIATREDGGKTNTPKRVFKKQRLIVSFINGVKSACIGDPSAYSLVSGYLIVALSNLMASITESGILREDISETELAAYNDFYHSVLEIMFHLYSETPNHKSSIQLFISTSLACSFFEAKIPEELNSIKSMIYVSCRRFFECSQNLSMAKSPDSVVLLERLNILTMLGELRGDYLIARENLEELFLPQGGDISYFQFVVVLHYIKKSDSYSRIRRKIIKSAMNKLSDLSDIGSSSEKIYFLLDMMTCPYVTADDKNKLAYSLYTQIHQRPPLIHEQEELVTQLSKFPWFVTWTGSDLVSVLEKKELLQGY